jgi:hypothetical protein
MNEHPRELTAEEYANRRRSAEVGAAAIERELFAPAAPDAPEVVELAIYVKGRLVHTKTDTATIQRIMAILTGLER